MGERTGKHWGWFGCYAASALIYGIALVLFLNLPYYHRALNDFARYAMLSLYGAYLAFSPIYYLSSDTPITENRNLQILRYLIAFFRSLCSGRFWRPNKEEKVSILFLGVKFFFLPIMLTFLGNHVAYFERVWRNPEAYVFYYIFISALFLIDVAIFAFGYLFEFDAWKNKTRSVEPTMLGWFVALACYPPFNRMWSVPWGANDETIYWGETSTTIMRFITGTLLVIYTLASVALGPKASNLTNRGIVSAFPYSIIRHPAYISKVLMWWITMLPRINISFVLGMGFWTFIYFLRTITEERHLMADPDYQAYCKKVRWRFVPGLY